MYKGDKILEKYFVFKWLFFMLILEEKKIIFIIFCEVCKLNDFFLCEKYI